MTTAGKRKWTEYSDSDKEAALNMLYLAGYPKRKGALSQTEKETGVPATTLLSWHKKAINGSKVRSVKKGEIVAKLNSIMDVLADHLLSIADTGDIRETAVAFGIVADKLQLLNEDPTQIIGGAKNAPLTITVRYADSD